MTPSLRLSLYGELKFLFAVQAHDNKKAIEYCVMSMAAMCLWETLEQPFVQGFRV